MSSVFQTKYNEFVEDLLGAVPEYAVEIQAAKDLSEPERLKQFKEVKFDETNLGFVLPGVNMTDTVWKSLSEKTQTAILEYVKILSMLCFMENGFSEPEFANENAMNEALNELKKKLEGVDFENVIKKFMTFFKPGDTNETGTKGFEKLFENGFPKIPEKFLKGHMAKLAQEIVKDIKPEDLGISKEMMEECEKTPSRAIDTLFKVFSSNPDIIQKTIQKIGKRLQEKIQSGSIKPQEIAREAEELMKEFSDNSSFVNMMDGIKKTFGFEDMDLARQAGKEGTARMSIVKERLKKKVAQREAKKASNTQDMTAATVKADAMMKELLRNEKKPKNKKK